MEKPVNKNFESLLTLTQASLLKKYTVYLEGLRLSASTVSTYRSFIVFLLLFWKERPLSELDNAAVQRFIEVVVKRKKYGISTHRQLVNLRKHFGDRFWHLPAGLRAEGMQARFQASTKRPNHTEAFPLSPKIGQPLLQRMDQFKTPSNV